MAHPAQIRRLRALHAAQSQELRPSYRELAQHLGNCGAMDLGVLNVQQDLRQRSHSIGIAIGVLNQRNDDLRRLIESLSK